MSKSSSALSPHASSKHPSPHFVLFDPSKRPNPQGCRTSRPFFDRSGMVSRTLRQSRIVPVSAALGRLDASKVEKLLRRGLTGAVGGPCLLEIDPAVALPVRQPGRMHGERDDVEGG
jgi:hypothetical protein